MFWDETRLESFHFWREIASSHLRHLLNMKGTERGGVAMAMMTVMMLAHLQQIHAFFSGGSLLMSKASDVGRVSAKRLALRAGIFCTFMHTRTRTKTHTDTHTHKHTQIFESHIAPSVCWCI